MSVTKDDDDDDDANTARRAAARRSETLKCPSKRKLKIVGVVPLDEGDHPASASASVCPYLAGVLSTVQGRCDGRQQCKLSRTDIAVSRKQCPGVASVNFRVRCIRKGSFAPGRKFRFPDRSPTPTLLLATPRRVYVITDLY